MNDKIFKAALDRLRHSKDDLDIVLEQFVAQQNADNSLPNLPSSRSMARYTVDQFELFWVESIHPKRDVSPQELKTCIDTLLRYGYSVNPPKKETL